jgi:deoxyribose-phosphate aldolase
LNDVNRASEMRLNAGDIARMIDLSCVRTASSRADIETMVQAARRYGFGHVSVLQCFIPYTKQLLQAAPGVFLVGNVSFPTGSDTTSLKIAQAKELVASGCDEIDMVMNIGSLRSGDLAEVEEDVRAVIATVNPIPVKVIIEIMVFTAEETAQACTICLRAWLNPWSVIASRSKPPVVSAASTHCLQCMLPVRSASA